MLTRLRSRAQEEKGFTLIELLVVVLIIGILAAIAIPAFLGQKKGAQDANGKSLLRNSAIALESFYSENQSFDNPGAAAGTALTVPDLTAIEPNITWTIAGITGLAKDNVVNVNVSIQGGTTNNRYVLVTNSASGNFFTYYRNEQAQTFRCKAAAQPAALPAWVAPVAPAGSTTAACAANQW